MEKEQLQKQAHNIEVGRRFERVRHIYGKTPEDFAAALNLDVQKIQKIEAGKIQVSLEICLRLYDVYHVNLNWLRLGEPDFDVTPCGTYEIVLRLKAALKTICDIFPEDEIERG